MAFTTGTVTGHDALLTVLRDFLTTDAGLIALNQNWTLEKEETVTPYTHFQISSVTAMTGNFRDVYLRGPGLAGQDNVHVNIRQFESTSGGYRNWEIGGATGFDGGLAYENQPGADFEQLDVPIAILTSAAIQYWIVANGRRFMMVYKVEGDFFMMHAGLILPYGKPSEYPYPHLITGHTGTYTNTPATINIHNFYRTVISYSAQLRRPSGTWLKIHYNSLSALNNNVWPYCLTEAVGNAIWLQQNPDSSFTLLPIILFTTGDGFNVYGEPQGLFYVGKRGVTDLASEDTITIGGDTYLVFQDVDDQADHAYCCMLLE